MSKNISQFPAMNRQEQEVARRLIAFFELREDDLAVQTSPDGTAHVQFSPEYLTKPTITLMDMAANLGGDMNLSSVIVTGHGTKLEFLDKVETVAQNLPTPSRNR